MPKKHQQTGDIEERRKSVLEEKRHVSSKISDLSRYVGFGLVAVVYAILTSDSEIVIQLYEHYTTALLTAAAFGVLTVILDYLQFLGGYLSVEQALQNEEGSFRYDNKSFWYKLRVTAFWMKQATAFFGALLFAGVITISAVCA